MTCEAEFRRLRASCEAGRKTTVTIFLAFFQPRIRPDTCAVGPVKYSDGLCTTSCRCSFTTGRVVQRPAIRGGEPTALRLLINARLVRAAVVRGLQFAIRHGE